MYVISYDISLTKIRNKVAKELQNYGKRVQYSVFECAISKARFDELYKKLCKLMEKNENGNIKIYYVCENCEKKVKVIGIPDLSSEYDKEEIIII